MSLAWHVAALNRAKRLPKLQSLFVKKTRRRQPWQEQMQVMDMWVAATRQMSKKPKGK